MGNYFKNAPLAPKEESVMERHERLQKAWEEKLPCKNCPVAEVCKYHSVATKRIDYPEDIFEIKFSCKIRNKIKNGIDLSSSNDNAPELEGNHD